MANVVKQWQGRHATSKVVDTNTSNLHRLLRTGLLLAVAIATVMSAAGAGWENITGNVPGAVSASNIGSIATDGTRIYVLGTTGVYVSSDGGNSFTAINSVPGATYNLGTYGIRFIGYANGEMWVGHDPGSAAFNDGLATLHRHTPGTTTWSKSSNGFPAGQTGNQADDIAYDATTDTYYALGALGGAFVSTDGGHNWAAMNNGMGGIGLPASIETLNGAAFATRPLGNVRKTVDQGANWTDTMIPGFVAPGHMEVHNGRLLVPVGGNNTLQDGLYVSDDAAATWTFLKTLTRTQDLESDGTYIWAAGAGALNFSGTDGLSWKAVDSMDTGGGNIAGSSTRMIRVGNTLFLHCTSAIYRRATAELDLTQPTEVVLDPVSSPSLLEGDSYTMSVLAAGSNLSYQWYLGSDPVPNATSATLQLTDLTVAQAGNYTCQVTGDTGMDTSAVAVVSVTARDEGHYDPTFPETQFNRWNANLEVLNDYSVIELSVNFIARVNPDGSRYLASRNLSGSEQAYHMLLDSQGRLVLAGNNRIYRINPLTLQNDPTFAPLDVTQGFTALAELPGRGYLVGTAGYATYNSAPLNLIILIDYEGNIDPSFDVGQPIGENYGNQANRIFVQDSNTIYAGGNWLSWHGASALQNVVALDATGAVKGSFQPTLTNPPTYVHLLRNGQLLVARESFNGYLKRLNPDGSVDATFNVAANIFNDSITDIVEQFDGKLVVSGEFGTYGSDAVGKYVRLSAEGVRDTTFYDAVGYVSNTDFFDSAYDPRGYIYFSPDSGNSADTFQDSGINGLVRVFTSPPGLALWRQSGSQRVDQAGSVTLSALAFGSNVTYQWYFKGGILNGQTGSTLTIANFQPANSGEYYVVISDGSTSIPGSPINLQVVGSPEIGTQPVGVTAAAGESHTLSVSATGAGTLNYQWFHNGMEVPSATSSTLPFGSLQLGDSGTYYVKVSNDLGNIESNRVLISVNEITGKSVTTFNSGTVLNLTAYGLAVLPDKSVIVGGDFTTVNGVSHPLFTRLDAAGAPVNGAWTANPPGGGTGIRGYDIEPLSNGQFLIAGQVSSYQSHSVGQVARVNANGAVDTTFMNAGIASYAESVTELTNHKILVAGTFTSPRQFLARLNEDGSLDTSFTLNGNDWVHKVVALPDGGAYVAGRFTTLGGVSRSRIARLLANGELDPAFVPPTINGEIYDFDLDPQGRIVIGGTFSVVDGQTRYYAARLKSDGALDSTFNTGTLFNNFIYAVDVQLNGKIVLGGTPGSRLYRLLPSGAIDPYFQMTAAPNSQVFDVESTPDGFLYVAGAFTSAGGKNNRYITVLTTDKSDLAITQQPGSQDVDLGGDLTLTVGVYTSSTASYQWFKGTQMLAGETGTTLTITGVTREAAGTYYVKVTNDSGTTTSNGAVIKVLAEPVITLQPVAQTVPEGGAASFSIAAQGAGTLLYQWYLNGGELTGETASTLSIPSVALDDSGYYEVKVTNDLGHQTSFAAGLGVYVASGSIDASFSPSTPPNSTVFAVAALSNGNVALGGSFTTINGSSRARFAVLTPQGALVNLPTNPGYFSTVSAIAAQSDGKFIVTHFSGFERRNTDGTIDNSFPSDGSNQCGAVKIAGEWAYIGGFFGGPGVRKININTGMEDTTFAANATVCNGWYVQAIGIQADGKVLIGDNSARIARLNTNGTTDGTFTATGASLKLNQFYDFAQTADGRIWVGGSASTIVANSYPYLAPLLDSGAIDTSIGGAAINSAVYCLQALGNDVIVGGAFFKLVDTIYYRGVIRVSGATGAFDPEFGPVLNSTSVYGLDLQPDGKLIVGGSFQGPPNYIARVVAQADVTLAITGDPRDVTVAEGDPFTLSVGWKGGSVATYQWYQGTTMIPSATGQSYTVETAEAGNAGEYKVEVTDTSGTVTSAVATVTVTPAAGAGQNFSDWAQSKGLMMGEDGLLDDPDMDGIPNFKEFLYGLDPKSADMQPEVRPHFVVVESGGKNYPGIRFRRARNLRGYQMVVEAVQGITSDTLETTMEESAVDVGNDVDEATYRCTLEYETLGQIFFKLRILQDE